MAFGTGDRVRIKPLGDQLGRVVGGQGTGRLEKTLYIVRYAVGTGHSAQMTSSLFFDDELSLMHGVAVEDGQHLPGDDRGVDP